jgi:O-antigen/teichoic acid export membrane protein
MPVHAPTTAPPDAPPGDLLDEQGRPPAHNAAMAAVAEVVGKFSTLAWTIVAARLLTQEEFGAFNLIFAIAIIAGAVAEGGFDQILVRRASRNPRNIRAYYTQAIAWELSLAVPVFCVAAAAVWVARPDGDARAAALLLLLALFFDQWSDTARAAAAAARDQAAISGALAVQRLAAAALMIPALIAGLGLAGMAAGFLASAVIGWLAHVRAVRPLGLRFQRSAVEPARMTAFARGSWTLGFSALVLIAMFRIDVVILAALQGDEAVGEYSAAYRLFETVLFLSWAVVGAVAPLMNARSADRDEVRRLTETSLVVLGFAFAPFAAVSLTEGRAVLELLYGSSYAGATAAVQWLAFAPLVYAAGAVLGAALIAVGRLRGVAIAAVGALGVNVALNLLLIPSLSGTGAALATTAAFAVDAALCYAFVARHLPRLHIVAPLTETLAAAAVMALALELAPLPLLVELPLAVAAYAAVWLALVRTRRPERLDAVRTLLLRGRPPADAPGPA